MYIIISILLFFGERHQDMKFFVPLSVRGRN